MGFSLESSKPRQSRHHDLLFTPYLFMRRGIWSPAQSTAHNIHNFIAAHHTQRIWGAARQGMLCVSGSEGCAAKARNFRGTGGGIVVATASTEARNVPIGEAQERCSGESLHPCRHRPTGHAAEVGEDSLAGGVRGAELGEGCCMSTCRLVAY
jgi:hypothetical protein